MTLRAAGRWAGVCIAVGSGLVLLTIVRTSITQDEPSFYSYGERVLLKGEFSRVWPSDNSKLPVSALNVVPAWLGARSGLSAAPLTGFLQRAFEPEEAIYIREHLAIYAGRVITLLFYVVLCWLVFAWGSEIYGARGALAATALIAFLPVVLGHAGLVTVDVAAACTILAAVYAVARCFRDPSLSRALLAGLVLGAAQLVKYTAVGLWPIALLMLLARVVTARRTEAWWRVLHAGVTSLVIAALVAIGVINLGFAFQRSGVRLSELACRSDACHAMRGVVGNLLLPLPYEYVNGLDVVCLHDEQGLAGGNVYLLGRLSREGFPSYFLVATLLKTPLPFLVLLLTRPWRRQRRFVDLVWLAPVLWLFGHLSFFFHTQLGLRYFLPAFPFLALLAAANFEERRSVRLRWLATTLVATQLVTTLWQCPHYLAYFNALIGSRRDAYRYLADSNLDWGQDHFALLAWQRAHANDRYTLRPLGPTHGLVIVRANDLVGIDNPETFRWLRMQATPVQLIGDSFLLFDIP